MKNLPRNAAPLLLLIGACTLHASTWDITPGGTTPAAGDSAVTGGTGSWDLATYNWTDDGGLTNKLWTNGSDASFTGTGGTVTVGAALTAGNVTFSPSSGAYTLQLNNTLTATTVVANTGTKIFFAGNNAASKIIGNIDLEGGTIVANSGNNGTLNGLFTGSGALLMNDGASYGNVLTQTATNLSNSYAGNTTIVNNILQFSGYNTTSFTPFGSGSTVTLTGQNGSYSPTAGIIFNPSSTGSTYTVGQNLVLSSSTGNIAFIRNADGIVRFTGAASITTDGNTASTVQFVTQYNGKDIFLDGVLSGSGAMTVTDIGGNYGSGTVHLTNASNTYSGTITVNDASGAYGILSLDAASAAQSAVVNLAGTTNGGRLRVNTASATVGGLTGTAASAAVFTTSGTVQTLTVNNASANAFAGTIGVAGSYSYDNSNSTTNGANLALVKSGAGSLTLTGANAYVGGTTVTAGSLVTGNVSALGTGSVSVTGGVLQIGDGITHTVTFGSGANLVINGGTLKLDASLGTATTAVALSGGGKYTFNGTLDLSGVFNSAGAGTYALIGGGTGNTDTSVIIAGYSNAGFTAAFSNGNLVLTAVPEPSAYALSGAAALGIAALARRRRRA